MAGKVLAHVGNKYGAVDAAFVGGSLGHALGNPGSDIDLFLVVPRIQDVRVIQVMDRGGRVDVELTTWREVAEVPSTLKTFRDSSISHQQKNSLSTSALDRFFRLLTGTDIRPHPRLTAIRESTNHLAVRQFLVSMYASGNPSLCEDAAGALKGRDFPTALFVSDRALMNALQALTANHDRYYLNEKFLFRKLRQIPALDGHTRLAWRLLHAAIAPNAPQVRVTALVERRLLLANWILAHCLVDGWESAGITFPVARFGSAGPARSPYLSPTRYVDGLYLPGAHGGFSLEPEAAMLWALTDGSPLPSVTRRFARWLGLKAADIAGQVDESIRAMQRNGTVRRRPAN